MSEPTDISLADGVLSFDGRVVEAFGFFWEHPDQIRAAAPNLEDGG